MSNENPEKLGKYTLIRKIAEGGMAEIFLANQEGPSGFQKQLVIKRILPHLADDKKFVEMFLDEARIAAQFNNANIVQIYDLGEVDGSYFIAMEYIDGWDLSDIIERAAHFGKRVPSPIAARMIADALGGLHYAHEFKDPNSGEPLNLVHRDVSPQNLLVNKDGVVKLVDFGVAKARTSSAKTQTGAVKGKFSYMAPEQIAGEKLDGRCDIFAMSIVLYELLLGVRPFGEASDLMAITAIVHQQPKDPREIDESFPPELDRIIRKGLSKNRDERYASALDMQRDLEMYLQQSGVFITQREVSTYLQELFEGDAPPDLSAIGLEASSTHSYSLEDLKRSADQPVVEDEPASDEGAPTAVSEAAPAMEPPPTAASPSVPATDAAVEGEKKGISGLLVAVVLVGVLVVGGGGALVWLLMQDSGDAGEGETTASASDDTDGDDTTADAASAGDEADVVDDEPDAEAGTAEADATAASGDATTGEDAAAEGSDATAAAGDAEESDASVEGEPDVVAVAKADISHIDPEDLPGVSTEDVQPGFGVIRLKTNLKARVLHKGRKVGKTPATLTFPKGKHQVTLVSLDKKKKAKKEVSLEVFDQRRYELEIPFEKGELILETRPSKEFTVYIDGEKVGKTPLEGVQVYEGQHTVDLRRGRDHHHYSITILPKQKNPRTIRIKK